MDKKEEDINKEKENINYTKSEQGISFEDIISFLQVLATWLENAMEIFGKICLFFGQTAKYDKIQKQNEKFKIEYKKEMNEFEKERQEIIRKKQESVRKIHIEKKNRIKENDEKYNKILRYLDTIKNDKYKLKEFLERKNLF